MSLSQHLSNCSSSAISFPEIFGYEFLSIQASPVRDFSLAPLAQGYQLYREDGIGDNMSFCNVTLTHTHPNQNDRIISQVWLPMQSGWNGRLRMVGGGGVVAGLAYFTRLTMAVALGDGYATVTTNAGVPSDNSVDWILPSSGNLYMLALQNFAYEALQDAALAAKSVIKSFFGRLPLFSYFDGCSQGGQ